MWQLQTLPLFSSNTALKVEVLSSPLSWKFGWRLNVPLQKGWGATMSRLYRATTTRQFTCALVLIRSISEGWKTEMTLKPSVVLNLSINLVITKYKLKSQFKLTQLWPLTVNCFKVSFQSYPAGLSKICFLCTYVGQMMIQQIIVLLFLLVFFPLFLNVFTNILKIYELSKTYNEILKKLFTTIIYQVNSVITSSGFWTLLKMYNWGKILFWH